MLRTEGGQDDTTTLLESFSNSIEIKEESKFPAFKLPYLNCTLDWGPTSCCAGLSEIPYQPFSKFDRIGKIANWIGAGVPVERYTKQYHQFGAGGSAFTYVHEEDESTFAVVNTIVKKAYNYRKFGPNRKIQRGQQIRLQKNQQQQQPNSIVSSKGQQKRRIGNAARTAQNRYATFQQKKETLIRSPSISVGEDWELIETIDFLRFQDLSFEPENSMDLAFYGSLEYYDKTYDNIRTNATKRLEQTNRPYQNITTTDDPVIREFIRNNTGNVFATDTILSSLMTCSKSIYSWDIIAHRVENKLFFDCREENSLRNFEVSETSKNPPTDDCDSKINTPKLLALEANYINHTFTQQVTNKKEKVFKKTNGNPFKEGEEEQSSVMYRYRKWILGNGIELVSRASLDGILKTLSQESEYLTIKVLNEYTPATDWKQQLDVQPAAVLAAEFTKNRCKLAKWGINSILAQTKLMKIGYVCRTSPKIKTKHHIMGVQTYKTSEFCSQIHLNISNCWGVLRSIIDLLLEQPHGKYLLLKDPNMPQLHIYKVPESLFEESD